MNEAHDTRRIKEQFDLWLAARPDRAAFEALGKSYPVFLIAAQGGGIYASATILAFMTAMQDDCAGFTQHVFAISSVSGGAVGAAVFNALVADTLPVANLGCNAGTPEPGPLASAAAEIVERDHLSPALMQIWPDIIRTLVPGPSLFNRSTALERSFACAFEDRQSARFACDEARNGDGLRIPFDQHWRPDGNRPALIFNTTWSETGYRAAFAPFPLHAISDGTLFAFPDVKQPGDFSTFDVSMTVERSLIEAAFVSARFPAIVPSYAITATSANGEVSKLWNFVDGGYIDNSGATTALELYNTLDAHAAGNAVEFYLILLTDVTTDANLAAVESGTTLTDTVAPITALLSVRSQLADRAVTRAIDELNQSARREDLAGRTTRVSPVLAVNLKQTTFELPLGWKISRVTHDIVRKMLGRPELCRPNQYDELPPTYVERVINDNSCVKQSLRDLISAEGSRTQASNGP